MPRKKKEAQPNKSTNSYTYKGVQQFGDRKLWNKKNVHTFNPKENPTSTVGPCDIVDDLNPAAEYTFYLYRPSNTDDSATELDRLRRNGWIKCDETRFKSPTEKYEARDGALVLASGIWYAIPYAKYLENRKESREEMGPLTIASQHASLAASFAGKDTSANAETRADARGQRTEV